MKLSRTQVQTVTEDVEEEQSVCDPAALIREDQNCAVDAHTGLDLR